MAAERSRFMVNLNPTEDSSLLCQANITKHISHDLTPATFRPRPDLASSFGRFGNCRTQLSPSVRVHPGDVGSRNCVLTLLRCAAFSCMLYPLPCTRSKFFSPVMSDENMYLSQAYQGHFPRYVSIGFLGPPARHIPLPASPKIYPSPLGAIKALI